MTESLRRRTFFAAIAAGAVFIVLAGRHADFVNGPAYFRWPWYDRTDHLRVILTLGLASLPAFIAQFVRRRVVAVVLVAVTPLLLQSAASHAAPARAEDLIRDRVTTSYFTAAQGVEQRGGRWLRDYEQVLWKSPNHAKTKPPGPVAFFLILIRVFGEERAPRAAVICILLFASASVVATYFATNAIAGEDVALNAATVLALIPAMTAVFPAIDWLSPVFTVTALASWHIALERSSRAHAVIFALVVFVMSLWSYSLLTLGACLGLMTLRKRRWDLPVIAFATLAAAYTLLWVVTGFNPISAFQAAVREQALMSELLRRMSTVPRAYPATIIGDLQEFAFGMSWVPIVMAAGWLFRFRQEEPALRATALAGLAMPVVVALTGLLQAETSRVWIFMMPLVALPAALELSRWTRAQRVAACAVLTGCSIAVYSNALFLLLTTSR